MRFVSGLIAAVFLCGVIFVGHSSLLLAQESTSGQQFALAAELPDAPTPQNGSTGQSTQSRQNQDQQPLASDKGAQPGNSYSKAQTSQSADKQSQREKAAEQLKEEEQQRVVGVVPAFNTSYRWDAASLSAGQKMQLAVRSAVDPFAFAGSFLVAGYHEALNEDTGFGWGAEGYFKRSGAAYLDTVDSDIIGNGILPVLLHQDPRYFRLGHGAFHHRLLYALATTVVCRHDNTGKMEPNYSNVGGNLITGAISNLYYPAQDSGVGQTISSGMVVTAEGAAGAIFQEFWPDIARKVLHKDPTHGLDAQAKMADEAKKGAARGQQ